MDKRTLLFVACTTIAFYAVQSWFGWQSLEEKNAWKTAQEEKAYREAKEKQEDVAERTAPLSSLPLTAFYQDASETEVISHAILFPHAALTLSWTDRLPVSIYVPEMGKLELITQSHQLGEPVIYAKEGFQKIHLPSFSFETPFDLQLLELSHSPRVILGEQRGKEIFLTDQLESNAIAFIKNETTYHPIGAYNSEKQQLKLFREQQRLNGLIAQTKPSSPPIRPLSKEQFYIIENDYQQLVFSTKGGALAEINLPLRAKNNSKSLVKEIGPDRLIEEQSPINAQFPLYPATIIDDKTGQPIEKSPSTGGYYPLIRRSLLSASSQQRIDPKFYALNLTSADPSLSQLTYRVTRFQKDLIEFEATQNNRRIKKIFSIPKQKSGPYCFELEVRIDGDANGVWLSSGVPEVELLSGSFSPLLRYQVTTKKSSDVETIDLTDKKPIVHSLSFTPNWISNSNGFLGLILDPLSNIGEGYQAEKIPGEQVPSRFTLIDASHHLYSPGQFPGYSTSLPMKSGIKQTFRIFAGPFDESLLKELDDFYDEPLSRYNPDYVSAQSIQGWFSFISQPFAKFLYLLLRMFHGITHSWGFSIILLTIALRLMMYPLNSWSIQSAAKMQEINPKVKAIQEKYKKDPKKGQIETMNLYRKHGINPVSGCFPMFLQMPFLIGMFYLLKSSFPLRGASFIPGWIDNLAAPDVLFSWDTPVFFIGTQFHLLPLILGATMYLQQKMSSKLPKDPKDLTDAQKQQKMMGNIMSIVFTVMFYGFPSGLNLYFISSTLLGILQQWYLTKKMKNGPSETGPVSKKP